MAHRRRVIASVLAAASVLLLSRDTARAQACAVVSPSVVTPTITLMPGEFYFRDNGTPSPLLGTNPVGWQTT